MTITTPEALKLDYPVTRRIIDFIHETRKTFEAILLRQDPRLIVIIGPCSIHDTEAALEYAKRLKHLKDRYHDTLFIIMRAYVEKPRTVTGWKGFLNDPDLNHTFNIHKGLKLTRELFIALNQLGMPIGCELLNPYLAPYFIDLLSWGVIGARTTESQLHRELASLLPMPMGFKNNTDGNIDVALDAIYAANHAHHLLMLNEQGQFGMMQSQGNPFCHAILRGSRDATNYDEQSFVQTREALKMRGLLDAILIDCSHGNSQKDPEKQMQVIRALCQRIASQHHAPMGLLIESNLKHGKQSNQAPLIYGQSLTDACIGWEETETVLSQLHEAVSTSLSTVGEHQRALL